MRGNINEAMAEAVEGAKVVLICMSEKYKKSRNCKKGNVASNESHNLDENH